MLHTHTHVHAFGDFGDVVVQTAVIQLALKSLLSAGPFICYSGYRCTLLVL